MVNSLLESTSQKKSQNPAIVFADRIMTYAEVDTMANQCAHGLRALGIRQGDMVGILLPNSPEFIIAYFGIIKAGATVVPMNPMLSPDELHYIMNDAGLKVVFTIPPLLAGIEHIAPQIKTLRDVIVTGEKSQPFGISFRQLLGGMHSTSPGISVENTQAAVCIYTSGTTGHPKGALLTHRNLLSNVASILRVFSTHETDAFSCILPLFHAYSATVCMLMPVSIGARIVVFDSFVPRKCLQAIHDHRITVFVGVPAMFAVLGHLKNTNDYDVSSLRFCVAGGAPLPAEVLETFESIYKVKIYEGDGPTECSPVTSVNPIGGKRKVGSIGLPVPDVEMKIVDDEGNDLPPNQVGEIVVRGPNVMKGYLNQPKATDEAIVNGWFHTGDVGKMDDEGYFYILDRKKDMMIVGGLNVYAQEVETALKAHPTVLEAAVIGKPDKLRGEVPVAYLVPSEGKTIEPDELIRFCRAHLAKYKVPREIIARESLPKTATGKVMKWKLKGEV